MKKIDAIQMVRKIRDQQNKDTSKKTQKEIIDYFRKKAMKFDKKVETDQLNKR